MLVELSLESLRKSSVISDEKTMLRFALRWWAPFVVTTMLALAMLSLGSARAEIWGSSGLAFGTVVVVTALCAAGSAVVVVMGVVRRLPEVVLLGSVLWVASLLGMVHGLLLPGPLYGPNPGTSVAVMASIPCAMLAALPVLLDGTSVGRWLALRWKTWAMTWVMSPVVIGAALLVNPGLLPAPPPGGAAAVAIVAISLAGTGTLSLRHLRLYAIGRRGGSLLASLGFVAAGIATIAFLGAGPLSPGWWLAHLLDAAGVLLAVGGLLAAHWRDRAVAIVLSPVLTREPLVALELGLTPVVHRFVAALKEKDEVTREHVVRVAELAMRAGQRAGLDALSLRAVGLGGLLHDVGKLLTPEVILSKPDALTDQERRVIERHTTDGEAMIASYPHLSEVATIVRSHHERPDGHGYPDGLVGAQIPLTAAIVSVVDAWDAMVSDRPYRAGMPFDRATAILRAGVESQWFGRAVDVVLAEVDAHGPVLVPRLEHVGHSDRDGVRREGEDLLAACLPESASLTYAA
jgi:putative nucleotidyltransferase with HDIG domain